MITNNSITYYRKSLNENKLPVWKRYIFPKVWCFGGKGSRINKGYENANDVNVRIPQKQLDNTAFTVAQFNNSMVKEINEIEVKKLDPKYYYSRDFLSKFFKIGDIIAVGIQKEITKQSDLNEEEYYNITSININDFGHNPHVHLGGK